MCKGVPQGGVLSPLWYILYVRALDRHLHEQLEVLQYADDTLVHFGHRDMRAAHGILKEAIEALFDFYACRGLELNMSKTMIIPFSRGHIPLTPVVTKYGPIQMCNTARYLGIILDSHLKWTDQIDSLAQRCKMPLNILKSVAYVWWGADPACLLQLYKTLILSKLHAASHLWQQAAGTLLQRLNMIQNVSMRLILGAIHSTPIQSMLVETGLVPLTEVARNLQKPL